jgi:hypothetical protein
VRVLLSSTDGAGHFGPLRPFIEALGLQDLCRAVSAGTPQRAGGALGLHVVEVLLAIRDSARDGAAIAIAQQP